MVEGLEPIPVGAIELALEIEGHLRALLRDVICGHLALDLAELADELIGDAADEPLEAEAAAQPSVRGSASYRAPGRRSPLRGELFP